MHTFWKFPLVLPIKQLTWKLQGDFAELFYSAAEITIIFSKKSYLTTAFFINFSLINR